MTAQRDFLLSAMEELGLTQELFAARLGCEQRSLDRWLMLSTSIDYREMDRSTWGLVREIMAHEKSKATKAKGLMDAVQDRVFTA
jgi:hypothetical protein